MAKSKIVTPSASSKVLVVLLIIVSIAFIIGMGARTFGFVVSQGSSLVNDKTAQSVTLTDGSVYYGVVSSFGPEFVVLNNAHENTSLGKDKLTLEPVKGNIAGSSGSLYINRSEVLYWQNLEENGNVAETISTSVNSLGD